MLGRGVFVDDEGAAGLGAPAGNLRVAFQLAQGRHGQPGRVHFLDHEIIRHVGGDEAGKGGLARARLPGEPVGTARKPALAQGQQTVDDLLLSHDVGPALGLVLLRERSAE